MAAPTIPSASSVQDPAGASTPSYRGPFVVMTILFFMWGFITVWNDILIPRFKDAFQLTYFQAMLVQSAFFGAYGIGALAYFLISMFSGDPINRIGYKNGVILGLGITAAGCALFYPAALLVSYPLFLVGLFVIGLGLAMLQIAANPYVTILGPERTASSRLNLSQAFNSFGTTLGPIIGGWLVFAYFTKADAHGADSVKVPYLCFAAAFGILALLFRFARVPAFANRDAAAGGWGALKHPHTALGMLAIFMYVGGEVSVGSAIVNLLGTPGFGGMSHAEASRYLSFYWGGLMIGRFMGAFALSDLRGWLKHGLVVGVPLLAFGVIVNLPWIGGVLRQDWASAAAGLCAFANVKYYGLALVALVAAFFAGESSAHRMLAVFSAVILALLGLGAGGSGELARWAVLSIGLFCSVMWSNIFSLAIEGLGPLKSQGSSLLVMGIVGGAVLPAVQGRLADHAGIQASLLVPMAAFAYVGFYGLYGYRAGRGSAPVSAG
ncbi:MAG: sugar MFS transporter [Verrucomicrobiota bacterium]